MALRPFGLRRGPPPTELVEAAGPAAELVEERARPYDEAVLLAAIALVMVAVFARENWRVGVGMSMWLALAGVVARTGFLSDFEARPPRMMLVVVPALIAAVLWARRTSLPSAWWLIAIQTMRVPIELALFALYADGRIPKQMTFEGRNFDILVGLTAPFMAWAVARGRAPRALVIGWNVAGLALLTNIVTIAVTSIPGPLHLGWPGVPNTIVATFPTVWLPALLVPIALFGHVASLTRTHRHPHPHEWSTST